MENRDEILKQYMKRILRQEPEELTENDLKEVAKEMGPTEDDLKKIEEKVQSHILCGKGYLNHDCFDDAINEFKQALSLSPGKSEIFYYLAESYKKRWNIL